jgi:hypothetical protein
VHGEREFALAQQPIAVRPGNALVYLGDDGPARVERGDEIVGGKAEAVLAARVRAD